MRVEPGKSPKEHSFTTWWSVIALMLVALAVTFGFGALLFGYVLWIWLDPAQSFGSVWHPLVALPVALLVMAGSGWLFGYGIVILAGVIRALRELMKTTPAPPAGS